MKTEGWKLSHYASLYGKGKISMARAAHEAGVSLWEMMEYTRREKIAAQYDLADLEEDLAALAKSKD
jgi:predicted HTH domain antitoxin